MSRFASMHAFNSDYNRFDFVLSRMFLPLKLNIKVESRHVFPFHCYPWQICHCANDLIVRIVQTAEIGQPMNAELVNSFVPNNFSMTTKIGKPMNTPTSNNPRGKYHVVTMK